MRKIENSELNRLSVNEFKKSKKIPLVIILDNIRSQHNIGSVFRTSDAFRIEKIYLCGITATPPHREIHKAALGATESVDWQYIENTGTLIQQLKEEGYTIFAIEQAEGSILVDDFQYDYTAPLAVVFGNEVNGVDEEVMELVDGSIEIPQYGTKHSLNISVSAGIVIWELFKRFYTIRKEI
jgi:tRNA G18 (ribose-2'-O)-methylase SpoU